MEVGGGLVSQTDEAADRWRGGGGCDCCATYFVISFIVVPPRAVLCFSVGGVGDIFPLLALGRCGIAAHVGYTVVKGGKEAEEKFGGA